MFRDFTEFEQFMIFCHTHYSVSDVWHMKYGKNGILFEGWFENDGGTQKYSPTKLNEDDIPPFHKRITLMEVYDVWKKVSENLKQ